MSIANPIIALSSGGGGGADCVSDQMHIISQTFGYISIACWMIVGFPCDLLSFSVVLCCILTLTTRQKRQMWANYKSQSGESVSLAFLVIWLVGDAFNIAGVILNGLLLTMVLCLLLKCVRILTRAAWPAPRRHLVRHHGHCPHGPDLLLPLEASRLSGTL